jgi:CRISPR-associated protein Cmr6
MNTPNIGWLYFKDYLRINGDPTKLFFERIKWDQEEKEKKNDAKNKNFDRFFNGYKDDNGDYHSGKNQAILKLEFNNLVSGELSVISSNDKLRFKTTYPGLTLGTGYTHETGELGEFKLGFFFDHATGYPCIPGSTVKGCLRGMFPQKERYDADELSNSSEKYNYLASVIRELSNLKEGLIAENELGEEYDQKEHPKREAFIDRLELEIFEGKIPVIKEDGTIENQPICIYERDIFFDAYLVSTQHPAINRSSYQNSKPFIGDDYITPHINRKNPAMSPFTNPIPLMFLKILPEVTIQFQFDLKSREDGPLSKEQKEELFRRLLIDFGIGAKTNVGYGQFDEGENLPGSLPPPPPEFVDQIPSNAISSLRQRSSFPGEMIDQIGVYNIYQFKVGRDVCKVKKRTERNPTLKVGDKVNIQMKLDYKRGEPLTFQVK